jgi:glucose-1-phosphate cytidylyltransferase
MCAIITGRSIGSLRSRCSFSHRSEGVALKAVILAGGFGTRISEESALKPKPMIEIGGKPILWHILKTYAHYGVNDFVICCGYKGYVIKEYFANYLLYMSDVTIDLRADRVDVHSTVAEPWRITLVDTGEDTLTGGRLKRVRRYVEDDDFFFFTYGDGVADIDLHDLLRFHQRQGRLATVTAIQPAARFGALEIETGTVVGFQEKPRGEGGWVSGGYFVLSPRVFDYIDGDKTIWEREPMERLARERNLSAYQHGGFWQPLDTLRDKMILEELWASGRAPWRVWDDRRPAQAVDDDSAAAYARRASDQAIARRELRLTNGPPVNARKTTG